MSPNPKSRGQVVGELQILLNLAISALSSSEYLLLLLSLSSCGDRMGAVTSHITSSYNHLLK